MPPPPPTGIIAGGDENGFKKPPPKGKGIAMMVCLLFTCFHFFYWFMAPAGLFLLASYLYVEYTKKKNNTSAAAADRQPLTASSDPVDNSICHMNYHPMVMRVYKAISSHVLGTWFEVVSMLLEGLMGINFTYIVVASKAATAESTAAAATAQKAVTDVDTDFLTKRRDDDADDKKKEKSTLLTSGAASADKSGFVDGVSPKAQAAFNLSRPLTAIDVFKPPTKGRVNIILLNHRCRLDWMMLWPLIARAVGAGLTNAGTTHVHPLAALKIIMKQDLAYIPWLGYCTQMARSLFLRRRWEEDQKNVQTYMRYLASDAEEQSLLLIFPEGTDYCPAAIGRSNKYAEENGLPKYNYVLHPRTTGLLAMKNAIGTHKIDRIIDVTIAYADARKGDRTNDVHLLGGMMPSEISFITEAFVFDDNTDAPTKPDFEGVPAPVRVPADDKGFKEWVEARWAQKEKDMAKYYTAGNGQYGWDCVRDIESGQWADAKGTSYDRFVVGGTMETSIFNSPTKVVGGQHPNGGKIGTFGCFLKNTVLAGGLFGGNGATASIAGYIIKPLVNFGIPSYIYYIYAPFLAPCWWPFLLLNGWIVVSTIFFVVYLQKMCNKTFDQRFLFSQMAVPEEVLAAEKVRDDASTLPPAAAPTEKK